MSKSFSQVPCRTGVAILLAVRGVEMGTLGTV